MKNKLNTEQNKVCKEILLEFKKVVSLLDFNTLIFTLSFAFENSNFLYFFLIAMESVFIDMIL